MVLKGPWNTELLVLGDLARIDPFAELRDFWDGKTSCKKLL
jgi:hypothetical protein